MSRKKTLRSFEAKKDFFMNYLLQDIKKDFLEEKKRFFLGSEQKKKS